MNILPTYETNFKSGNILLKNIEPHEIKSIDAISKIAADNGMDVFISKNVCDSDNIFSIILSKKIPIFTRSFFEIGNMIKQSAGTAFTDKAASKNEVAVKIYNAFMSTVEKMNKN